MNREETRKAAEVMLHYANGGEVQYQNIRRVPVGWMNSESPDWDWYECKYRIKPKPIEITAYAVECGGVRTVHISRATADKRVAELRREMKSVPYIVELKGTYTCDT